MTKKMKVCFVVSNEMTIKTFLLEHLKILSAEYDIFIIAGSHCKYLNDIYGLNLTVIKIPISRDINILKDCISLARLFLLFKKYKFHIVHSVTPKAGLLSMIASFISRNKIRIHIFTGQVWVTKQGLVRIILKTADKIISRLATHILTDSFSQREFLINEKVMNKDKIQVLANGSICGVDISKFKPNSSVRKKLRNELSIPENNVVFLFVGRLKQDKGIFDLSTAFSKLCGIYDDINLLIVGPDEDNLETKVYSLIEDKNRVRIIKYTEQPEFYMAASDIFCLPSYREGFGNAIIEAAACGLPSVASRIYGITDAILENETGLLHKVGDVTKLGMLMEKLYLNSELRDTMARTARDRAELLFSSNIISRAWLDYYATIR